MKQHQVLAEANFLCCNIGAAGKKQPSRVNLSHKRGRFSFPSLVLSGGKKKNHSKSLTHLCLHSVPPRPRRGQLSARAGDPPVRRAEQHQDPRSRPCQPLAFSHSCNVTLAAESECQSPGLCTQDPWAPRGSPCCQTQSTRCLHPRASLPRCPSPP